MVARQLKSTLLMTMAVTPYRELKLLFFRNVELFFKTGYINKCILNISILNILGNDIACNDVVHSLSVNDSHLFLQTA